MNVTRAASVEGTQHAEALAARRPCVSVHLLPHVVIIVYQMLLLCVNIDPIFPCP